MKQRKIKGLGAIVEASLICLPFLGVVNFVMIAVGTYASIRPYISPIFPWMTLWKYLIFLFVVVLIAMFFIYKYVVPSLWSFRGRQMLDEENVKKIKQ